MVNDDLKTVTVDGEPVKLTPIEYNILVLLIKNQGKVFSIEQIYENIWLLPADEGDEDCDEVLIYTLKIDEDGSETLLPIEDEAELDMAFDEFKNRMGDEYEFEP